MFKRKQSREEQIMIGFLVGGIIGSLASFLFTPIKGKDLRKEIKDDMGDYLQKAKEQSQKIYNETKALSSSMIDRAQNVFELSRHYASGVLDVPRDNVEKEISRLRKAVNAAVDAYKTSQAEAAASGEENLATTATQVNETFEGYNDETLPKQEGMGRREVH